MCLSRALSGAWQSLTHGLTETGASAICMETAQLKLHSLELQEPMPRQTRSVHQLSHLLLLPAVFAAGRLWHGCCDSDLIPRDALCNWHSLWGERLMATSDYKDPRRVLLGLDFQTVWGVLNVTQMFSSRKRDRSFEHPGRPVGLGESRVSSHTVLNHPGNDTLALWRPWSRLWWPEVPPLCPRRWNICDQVHFQAVAAVYWQNGTEMLQQRA